jgi:hypothetical protein
MKKMLFIAVVLSMALTPCAMVAQAPAAAPVVSAIPADQQATKEQLAKLFETMRFKEQLASVSKMMPTIMQQQFAEQARQMRKDHPERPAMTDEQQKASAEVMTKFMDKAINLYGSDEMMNQMGAIYQRHLTGADVEAITAFYASPAGQHMVAMSSVMMQEFMPAMMKNMQERIKPLIEEMDKEMQAIAKTSPGASADTGAKQNVVLPHLSTPANK